MSVSVSGSPPLAHREALTDSLLLRWPNLYRSRRVLAAVAINVVASLTSLYVATTLDHQESGIRFAFTALLLFTLSGFFQLCAGYILDWMAMREEFLLRSELCDAGIATRSRANIDLPIAVGIIDFFVSAPSALIAMALYLGYLAIESPLSIAVLAAVLSVCALPIARYYRWRGRLIFELREARNALVDTDLTDVVAYSTLIATFNELRMTFFYRQLAVDLLYKVVMFGSLALCIYLGGADSAFSTLVIMYLLVSSGTLLAHQLNSFQEDRKCLYRILEDFGIERSAPQGRGG